MWWQMYLLAVSGACVVQSSDRRLLEEPPTSKLSKISEVNDTIPRAKQVKHNIQHTHIRSAQSRWSRSTECQGQELPTSVKFNSPEIQVNRGRERWKYIVTWQMPDISSCAPPTAYMVRYPSNLSTPQKVTSTSHVVFADGNMKIKIFVSAVGAGGLESAKVQKEIITPKMRPQLSPVGLSVISTGPMCITLSWQPPTYPNGDITGYKYSCREDSWKRTGKTSTRQQLCRFEPNSDVQCKVKTINDVGESNSAIAHTTTACAAPEVPEEISSYVREEAYLPKDSKFHRRRITVHLPSENLKINCDSIINERIWFVGREPSDEDTATLDGLDAKTTYSINYQVTNNIGQSSEARSIIVTTGELAALHTRSDQSVDKVQHRQQDLKSTHMIRMKLMKQRKDGEEEKKRHKLRIAKHSSIRVPRSVDCDIVLEPAGNLTVGSFTVLQHDGRNRLRYKVTWQEPQSCGKPSYYITKFPDEISSEVRVSNNSIDVYADGNKQVTFYVYAVYEDDRRSIAVSTSILTAALRPQISPTSVSLSPDSPNCVTLSWQPPEFENGAITGYKFICDGEKNWTTLGPTKRRHQICAFEPFGSVRCQIKAANSEGFSNTASTYTQTLCAAPVLPADLSNYVTEEAYLPVGSEFHRRRITIQIPAEDITVNCREIIRTRCWFEGTDSDNAANGTIANLDALTTYAVLCQVTNDRNMMSQPQSVLVTTGELEPAALELSVVTVNLTCVSADWSKSQTTSQIITTYQYRCSKARELARTPYIDSSGKQSIMSCGYEKGDEVRCEVRAATAIGFGPSSSQTETTRCTRPSIAKVSVNDSIYTSETNKERISLNISWQAPLSNCDEVTNYTVVVGTRNSSHVVQQTLPGTDVVVDDLNPYTEYKIEVITTNNEGLASRADMEWLTSSAKPFDPPDVNLTLNASCAFLHIHSPSIPNGVITHFKYNCAITGHTNLPSPQVVNVTDVGTTQLKVCSFSSGSDISCSVIAVNTAGDSPAANFTAFIPLKLTEEIETSNLVQITDSDSTRTVELTLKPVEFENMAPTSLKYQILVTKEVHKNEAARSTFFDERYCDLKSMYEFAIARTLTQTCYIAVEVSSNILKQEGLTFVIGDDSLFGGYRNAPLEPGQNYSLMVVVFFNLQNGAEHSFFLEPFTFYSSVQEVEPSETYKVACSDLCLAIISATTVVVSAGILFTIAFLLRARIRRCVLTCSRKNAKANDEEYVASSPLPQHRPLPLRSIEQSIPLRHVDSIHIKKKKKTAANLEIQASSNSKMSSHDNSADCSTDPYYSMTKENIQKNVSLKRDSEFNADLATTPPHCAECDDVDPSPSFLTYLSKTSEKIPPVPAPRECSILRDFKRVETFLRSLTPTYTVANKEGNHDKNRVLDILPDDEHLVRLEGDGYINAIYVDSYDKENHMIVTQMPLSHTIRDFWEMIRQEKVKIILQLDRNQESEESLYGSTEDINVEVTADKTTKFLTKKSLIINSRPVSVFLSDAWATTKDSPDDLPDVDILLHHVEALSKHQEQSGDGKICVVDRDGCHKCGVFIAAYNMIIAKFKTSNLEELTISEIITRVRQRRHQFLSDLKVHELIYKVCNYFEEAYEADYPTFSVEMKLKDYTNVS